MKQKEILIIDDTTETIKVLIEILKKDYTTYFAKTGLKGIEIAKEKVPDIILLDILMPEMNGYEVCQQLTNDPITKNIPVIFVTAVSEAMDMAKGFSLGGVDYVTKPFLPEVVKARVATHIRLQESIRKLQEMYSLALDANPITGLPGNNSITKEIKSVMENKEDVCVIYADLDNFKAYNDTYGFACGDKIILHTANVFKQIQDDSECPDCFIGHIGGDDFVFILPSEKVDNFCSRFIEKFDNTIPSFYSQEDREQGFIYSKDRSGKNIQFPFISISMAGVTLKLSPYEEYLKIIDACTELKAEAKKVTGSYLKLNERRKPN